MTQEILKYLFQFSFVKAFFNKDREDQIHFPASQKPPRITRQFSLQHHQIFLQNSDQFHPPKNISGE